MTDAEVKFTRSFPCLAVDLLAVIQTQRAHGSIVSDAGAIGCPEIAEIDMAVSPDIACVVKEHKAEGPLGIQPHLGIEHDHARAARGDGVPCSIGIRRTHQVLPVSSDRCTAAEIEPLMQRDLERVAVGPGLAGAA